MNVTALLAELDAAGIRLGRDGDDLVADVLPGAELDAYRERIQQNKPALVKELLQREIVEAAAAVGGAFDRDAYDALWVRWYTLRDQEHSQAPDDGHVSRSPVTASTPPAGWDGALCDECEWQEFCHVLGPRGPHLPGGPCAAWPADAVAHDDTDDEPAIARVLAHLAEFTPQEVEQFRQEVAAAPDDDPFIVIDREALARFDARINHTIGVRA